MKKLLTVLALCAALTATAHAQQRQTDRDFSCLKGPVKSVTVEAATLKKQGERYAEGRRIVTERVTYNADGNKAEDEWYIEEDGRLIKKSTYRYVRGQKLAEGEVIIPTIRAPVFSAQPGGAALPPAREPTSAPPAMRPVSEKYKYKYDAAGRIREMTIEENGRERSRITYVYKGAHKETRSYAAGEGLVNRQVDIFDARGNLTESANFETDTGAVRYKEFYTEHEFDARGNWVKRLKRWVSSEGEEVRLAQYRTITYF